MTNKVLEQLGLNETQIRVYIALLSVGTAPASTIARRLNMPRSTARYTCQQLASKGIIIMSNKNNTLLFAAKDPSNLINLLENEYQSIKKKEEALNSVMDELKNLYNPSANPPKVLYFEGEDGVINMLNDVLNEESTIYGVLRLDDEMSPKMTKYFRETYIPTRSKTKNSAFMIFDDNQITRAYREKDKDLNRTSLLVPNMEFPFQQCIHIYSNKIAFYFSKRHQESGVIIEDTQMRNTQFSLFKLAWNAARNLEANEMYKNVSLDETL